MSHELKTPLSGMIGMLRVASLEQFVADPGHVKCCIGKALSCGQLLLSLVDDLLDRTRLTTGNFCAVPTWVSIVEIVENVLDLATHLNRLKLDVRLRVDDSLKREDGAGHNVRHYLDPDRVFQLLLNVVTNALKFTPRGGSIEVGVSLHKRSLPCHSAESASSLESLPLIARFTVHDSGIGIAPDQIEHCFEPFAKLHQDGGSDATNFNFGDTEETPTEGPRESFKSVETMQKQGTRSMTGSIGLGLHLCREIVDKMGGTISMASKVGEGTTITIELPTKGTELLPEDSPFRPAIVSQPSVQGSVHPQGDLRQNCVLPVHHAREEGEEKACVASGVSAPNGRALRCLIVDDHSYCREIGAALLGAMGHQICGQADNGAEAVALFEEAQRRGQPVELILMDVSMPEMDGLQATQRIRELENGHLEGDGDSDGNPLLRPAVVIGATAYNLPPIRALLSRRNESLPTKPVSYASLRLIVDTTYRRQLRRCRLVKVKSSLERFSAHVALPTRIR